MKPDYVLRPGMRRPKTEVNTFIDRLTGTIKVEDDSFETITQERSDLAKRQEDLKTVLAECREAAPHICANIEQMFPVSLVAFLHLWSIVRVEPHLFDKNLP